MQAQSTGPGAAYRQQLIEGFCAAVEKKGYAGTTIADIVTCARVSKRTFYEHFADKDECFLAAYRSVSDQLMSAIAGAVDPREPWERQVQAAVSAYLALLAQRPALTRTLFLEIHAAGPGALALRRQVLEEFAELARRLVDAGRKGRAELRGLSPSMALAIVGGINELVLLTLEPGARGKLTDVGKTAVELLRAVITAGPGDAGGQGQRR
jgi:AcrR family transcriptional regulator